MATKTKVAAKKAAPKKKSPAKKVPAKKAAPKHAGSNVLVLEPGREYNLPRSIIKHDKEQPREDFDMVKMANLAASIKKAGRPEHAISVRPDPDEPGTFIIVDGARREIATGLADIDTIPAKLSHAAAQAEQQKDPFALKLDQAALNEHGEPLNAMEWGKLFQQMHEEGYTDSEIEGSLAERGITGKGRAYISNLRRLMQLPDWAKQMIREGRLSGAHGKYLLQGLASAAVMASMEKTLSAKGDEAIETVKELQDALRETYGEHHLPLDRGYLQIGTQWTQRYFDPTKTCGKCTNRVTVGDDASPFCLDEKCFKKKNGDAKAKESAQRGAPGSQPHSRVTTASRTEPTPCTVLEGNRVDVEAENLNEDDDYINLEFQDKRLISACAGCQYRHTAEALADEYSTDACFNLPCFEAKEAAFDAQQERDRPAHRLIGDWIGEALRRRVEEHVPTQLGIITYLAISDNSGLPIDMRREIGLANLSACLATPEALQTHAAAIASAVVEDFDYGEARILADHLGIGVDGCRVDERYLNNLGGEQLRALIQEAGLPALAAEAGDCKDDKELRALVLENADVVGCPDAVRASWETFGIGYQGLDADDPEEGPEDDPAEVQEELPLASQEEPAPDDDDGRDDPHNTRHYPSVENSDSEEA